MYLFHGTGEASSGSGWVDQSLGNMFNLDEILSLCGVCQMCSRLPGETSLVLPDLSILTWILDFPTLTTSP